MKNKISRTISIAIILVILTVQYPSVYTLAADDADNVGIENDTPSDDEAEITENSDSVIDDENIDCENNAEEEEEKSNEEIENSDENDEEQENDVKDDSDNSEETEDECDDNDEKNPDEDNTEEEILNENDTISENVAEEDEGSEEVTVSDNTAEDEIILEEDSEQEIYDSAPGLKPLPDLTGDVRTDVANIGYSQVGYRAEEPKYNAFSYELNEAGWTCKNNASWCAIFAAWCVYKAGLDRDKWPSNINQTTEGVRWFQNQGRWHDNVSYDWYYGSVSGGGNEDGYIPNVGDFVAIETNGSRGDGPDHTAIVYSVEGTTITTIEGNYGTTNYSPGRVEKCSYDLSSSKLVGFGEVDYGPSAHLPIGNVDVIEGGNGNIFVRGWAYDPDDTSAQLSISVYIGGPAGSGAEGYLITANTERSDVDEAMGCGAYHGFHQTINVGARGSQKIYIYASDVGEHWIGNPELPGSGQTVTINNKSAYAINFPYDSVELKTGETKTIDFTFQGDGIYTFNATIDNWDIANAAVTSPDWTKNPVPTSIVLTGKSAGTTSWTYYLLDSNENVLYQKNMTVKVVQSVTGITLNKSSMSLNVGGTDTLTATVRPSNASNKNVTWSSNNTSVATVSSSGVVTATGAGTATITVKTADGSYTATCNVTVVRPQTAFAINFPYDILEMVPGEKKTIDFTFQGDGIHSCNAGIDNGDVMTGVCNSIDWSKNPVPVSMTMTAKAAGTTSWSFDLLDDDGNILYSKTMQVKVSQPVTGVTLNKNFMSLSAGYNELLTASILPAGASNKDVIWSSNNTSVVTVLDGLVSAKAPGIATVTVKTADGGYQASCTITVTQRVTGVMLDKTSLQLATGESMGLTATVVPNNASNKNVTWSSSDSGVASVSSSGVITAKEVGTAIITVKTNDGSYTQTCTVTVTQAVTGISLSVTGGDKSVNIDSVETVLGNNLCLRANLKPVDNTNKTITWNSSDEAVATVVPISAVCGYVQTRKEGTTWISATVVDGNEIYTAKCLVTVNPVDTDQYSINVVSDLEQIEVDNSGKFEFTYVGSNVRRIEYSIADTSLVRIGASSWEISDEEGGGTVYLTGVRAGTTTLTVSLCAANGSVLYEQSFTINTVRVKDKIYDITVTKKTEEVEENGIVTFRFDYVGTNIDYMEFHIDDDSVIRCKESGTFGNAKEGSGYIKIKGVNEGFSLMKVMIKDLNGNMVYEENYLIEVVGVTSNQYCGDISGDDRINAADRIYLARSLAGWSGYPVRNELTADVNMDEKVNAADRIYLARYLAGWNGYDIE